MRTALEERVGELLRTRGLTLAVAESCTGGLLSHLITNVPGSSAYFLGGVVAYSNAAKERLLGVRRETLEEGAVSAAAAKEMARGARALFGTDLALATTGIAGPGGGTADKPVGLVYIALAAQDRELCERRIWRSGRMENKLRSAERALEMLKEYLEGRD
ncbi:TPA: CinA family protein [Candidatus Bipolaricaulota bacterium]|nr:CinA family protein [Candidatus Bipolaricaulota bacterium]